MIAKKGMTAVLCLLLAFAISSCTTEADNSETVENKVTAVSIKPANVEIAAEGSTTLKAVPDVTGKPTLTYEWTLSEESAAYAKLSATTGETITLTGNNITTEAHKVSITVTASDGTNKVSSEAVVITVKAKSADGEPEPLPDGVTLTALEVVTKPTTTSYAVGDMFSDAGLTLTAIYSDNSTKTLSATDSGVNVPTPDMTTTGEKTITVTYTDGDIKKAASFTIMVTETSTIGSVSITPSTKTIAATDSVELKAAITGTAAASYAWSISPSDVNATLSATIGATVTLIAKNATSDDITYTVKVVVTNAANASDKEEGSCTITVKAPVTLTKLEITKQPTVIRYPVNGTFSAAGLELTATYSDGSTKTLSATDISVKSAPDMATTGTKTVTVTYTDEFGSKEATFDIIVAELSSLAVATPPAVTSYAMGGTFSEEGLTLTATYSDGNTKTLFATDSGVQLSTLDMATAGTKIVTVTYTDAFGSAQTSFSITVRSPAAGFEFELLSGSDLSVAYDATTHTFTAAPPDADASYTYTWYIDDDNVPKATGSAATYTISESDITALSDGDSHQLLLVAEDASDSNLKYTAHCTVTVKQ